jgi:hypothetical protein
MARKHKPTQPERKEPQRSSSALVVHHSPQVTRPGSADAGWALSAPLELFHELHNVWMQLAGGWSWLTVIPADASFSTAQFAKGLSVVGAKFSGAPIDFIEGTNVDLDKSAWIIGRLGTQVSGSESWRGPSESQGGWTKPVTRTLVSLDSPVSNPLAMPVALASDGVILCVQRNRTPISEVRKCIDTVGANRVLCCVLIE